MEAEVQGPSKRNITLSNLDHSKAQKVPILSHLQSFSSNEPLTH